MTADIVLDCSNELGECILFDQATSSLWWVNIHQSEIWRLDDRKAEATVYKLPSRVGAIAFRRFGGLVVGSEKAFAFYDPADGSYEVIADIETDLASTRLNDGRCDRQGRFVCGGMSEASDGPLSNVYRLGPGAEVATLIPGVRCSNSICFSPSGSTLYFSDMPTGEIVAYDYDVDTGAVANKRVVVEASTAPGLPDGSVVDADGCIWNARWGAGKVIRFTPDGKVDRSFDLPATNVSCVGFGGSDLKSLFVTTARFGLTSAQLMAEPHAGGLFVMEAGSVGLPEVHFHG